nr:O-antigen ligase family protein [Faecalibaculum rodentium]
MEILALILVLSFPEIIPRGSNLSTLFSRIKIWDGAVVLIQMHPLFGMGPVTYGFMYGTMGFHKAPHAHNLLLESLTSYGLVGTTLITGYFVTLIRETMGIMQEHPTTFSLIISFYFTALVLGLLDFTLNFPVTGITFLMVANASCMWKQPVTQPAATAA